MKLEDIKLPKTQENDLNDIPHAGKAFAKSIVGFNPINDHQTITADDGAWQQLVRAYLATCSFADANVGRILTALEKSPHANNTIIILWGDHGWHLGEKEHWRKMSLWERGTKTPFIIKMPNTNGNTQNIEAPVSLQDIFPTLVDLCKLKVTQQLDGNSLKPLLTNPDTKWDKPVIISHGPGNFAVRQDHWRLIRYADGSEELYDLSKDAHEFTNLANQADHKKTLSELRSHLPKTWPYIMGPRFKKFSDSFSPPPKQQKK